MKITLKPLGPVDPAVLDHLRVQLGEFGDVTVGAAGPLPRSAYDAEKRQFSASSLFDACQSDPGDRVLGVTQGDLYEGQLKSVFGYAQIGGRVAVISTARLQGKPQRIRARRPRVRRRTRRKRDKFLERCVKEAVHELGHTLGLAHDERDPECVMYFSATLADTDRKGREFCAECAPQAEVTLRRLRT